MYTHLPKGNASYINRLNKIKILNAIRERNEISRAEIVKVTGLSAPTVTRAVESLIHEEKLVCQVGIGNSSGGRPPILVRLNNEENFVIGIDLGTTNIRGALSNLNAEILSEVQSPTEVDSGFESVLKKVGDVITELMSDRRVIHKRVFGIGMAVAGLINRRNSIIEFSPDFGWRNANIGNEMSRQFQIPIVFDNVSRVMALGERWNGIGKQFRDFICVNIGYGIGAGIIIDGKPFFGSEGMSGEFGHMTLEKNSNVLCKCGKYGCLEALASGRGIALAAENELKKGNTSKLMHLCEGDFSKLNAKMVFDSAKEGDPLATGVFLQATEYIGIGIANLIELFNPQAVVIGGGVSQSGEFFIQKIKEAVERHVIERYARGVEIRPAMHGADEAVMGAVSLILEKVLNLELLGD
jgi:glucokinase-like ROK family protein